MAIAKIINANNHNDFKIVPARDNTPRQFILTRYGRSYNLCDTGNPHYLRLCESMGYVFNLDPGYYKLDIIGDSMHIRFITEEQYKSSNPPKPDNNDY